MSDEYLWTRKGSDTEIEGLEDLLSEFRYLPGRAVRLPVTNFIAEPAAPRRFRWIFVFSAPALAALLLAVWFAFRTNEGSLRARVLVAEGPQHSVSTDAAPRLENTEGRATAAYNTVPVRKPSPTIIRTVLRPKSTKRQRIETLVATTKLTKEEKYAYDRLMLALAIAGNKLKVVQDTIDRKSDLDQKIINSNK